MTNRTFYTTKQNLALTISFLKPLTKCYKTYVGRFLIKNKVLVLSCGAEVSRGHFLQSVLRRQCRSVSNFCVGAEVSIGYFGTSAEMSWVRSVLGPKCPYTHGIMSI